LFGFGAIMGDSNIDDATREAVCRLIGALLDLRGGAGSVSFNWLRLLRWANVFERWSRSGLFAGMYTLLLLSCNKPKPHQQLTYLIPII